MTKSKLTSHYVSITVSVSVLWLLCYATLTLQSIWNFLHKQQTRSITKNHNQHSIHCWNNTTYWFHAISSLMKFLTHTIKSVICCKAWIMHINGRSNMNLTLQYVNFNKKLSYHQGTTQHNVCHNCKKTVNSATMCSTIVGVIHKFNRRWVLMTTRIHHRPAMAKIFLVQSLGQSSRGRWPYFWRYSNFLT